ncbi:MAG: hypothetical protein ABIG89_05880 [Candidatus Woesearchaeota archaeon]
MADLELWKGYNLSDFWLHSDLSDDLARKISSTMSASTREIVASNEALAREGITVSDRMSSSLREVVRQTHYMGENIAVALGYSDEKRHYDHEELVWHLGKTNSMLREIDVTFRWGVSKVLTEIGRVADSLETLIEQARTKIEDTAYNSFNLARDNFRKGLYQECLDRLDEAVKGIGGLPGYKEEWRFHFFRGTVHIGSHAMVRDEQARDFFDPAEAEKAFLLAVRYAKFDFPKDAAIAMMSASQAAYIQKKLDVAEKYAKISIELCSELHEARFQLARVFMEKDQPQDAFPNLRTIIEHDWRYLIKAAGDSAFQKHQEELDDFAEEYRSNLWAGFIEDVCSEYEIVLPNIERISELASNPIIVKWKDLLFDTGEPWQIADIIHYQKNQTLKKDSSQLNKTIDELLSKNWKNIMQALKEAEQYTSRFHELDQSSIIDRWRSYEERKKYDDDVTYTVSHAQDDIFSVKILTDRLCKEEKKYLAVIDDIRSRLDKYNCLISRYKRIAEHPVIFSH